MRRILSVVAATIAAVILAGVVSNAVSQHAVEARVREDCENNIAQVAKMWRLTPPPVKRLPESAIRVAPVNAPGEKRIMVQFPPNAEPPFAYAQAHQVAPFVLAVEYGWAVKGSRMAFGSGGEQIVLSVFGCVKILRDRPDWHL